MICNAGINHAGPALRLGVDHLDAVLAVNLRGAFMTAREGTERMIDRGCNEAQRRIGFIASILGTKPMRGAAVYAATKAGVIILAKGLTLEWARHRISVNTLCPGFMPTEIIDEWFETEAGRTEAARWPRRASMPVDALDPAMLFLLSAAACATTGATLTNDDVQSLA